MCEASRQFLIDRDPFSAAVALGWSLLIADSPRARYGMQRKQFTGESATLRFLLFLVNPRSISATTRPFRGTLASRAVDRRCADLRCRCAGRSGRGSEPRPPPSRSSAASAPPDTAIDGER